MSEINDEVKDLVDKLKNMDKIDIATGVVEMVVAHCVAAVVSVTIKNIAPEATTKKDQIELYIGTYAISHVVAHHASEHLCTSWNDRLKKLRSGIQKAEKDRLSQKTEVEEPTEDIPTPEVVSI